MKEPHKIKKKREVQGLVIVIYPNYIIINLLKTKKVLFNEI